MSPQEWTTLYLEIRGSRLRDQTAPAQYYAHCASCCYLKAPCRSTRYYCMRQRKTHLQCVPPPPPPMSTARSPHN